MYKYAIVVFLFLQVCFSVDAQLMLNINQKSTNKTSYDISTVQKITFNESNLVVVKKDATILSFQLQNVSYLDFNEVTTGLKLSTIENEYEIYPNPAIQSFRLTILNDFEPKSIDVQVVGIDGKLYINKKLFDINESVFVGNLSNGVYFCRINTGNIIRTIKFIKL